MFLLLKVAVCYIYLYFSTLPISQEGNVGSQVGYDQSIHQSVKCLYEAGPCNQNSTKFITFINLKISIQNLLHILLPLLN